MQNTSAINDCSNEVAVPIIGYHRSALSQKFGIPRQPNLVALPSYIEMVAPYNKLDAFAGIEDFSHLWIMWQTHHNHPQREFKPKVRPPRLGGNAKLGVFATRSTYRPSQMGLSVVKLDLVTATKQGVIVHITGADMLDGTPILDIKPYIAYSDAINKAKSGFAPDKPALRQVKITELIKQKISQLVDSHIDNKNSLSNDRNNNLKLPTISHYNRDDTPTLLADDILTYHDIEIISQLIAQDPRPAYRQKDTSKVYVMRYKRYDIRFKMDDYGILWIVDIDNIALDTVAVNNVDTDKI